MSDVLSHFSHVQKAGAGWTAHCPAHDDKRNSLSIAHGDRQPWLLKCFAGCSTAAILEAAGLTMADVSKPGNGHAHVKPQATVYKIRNVMGEIVALHERIPDSDGGKRFVWRQPDGTLGLNGSRVADLPLYGAERLQNLAAGSVLVVTEGERACGALLRCGIAAVGTVTGASGTPSDDVLRALVGYRVRLWADNDAPGRDHMTRIAARLTALGCADIGRIDWLEAPEHGDAANYPGDPTSLIDAAVMSTASMGNLAPAPAADGHATATHPPSVERASTSSQWPSPLGEAAYYGVFGDIVRALEPQTEADPSAVLVSLLAMFGNAVGRGPHFCVGRDTHHLNLFVGIVGQTAKGRKGMSHGEAFAVLREVLPEWAEANNTSGLSSGEGLIWGIRDPIVKKQPVREQGRVSGYQDVIEDHGVADKRQMVVESELASVLKVMAREGNILSTVIRQAWDGKTLNVKTKSNPATATNPHISIIGHITSTELLRYLQATDARNGFGNRFLWCCARRSKSLPDGGRPVSLTAHIERLQQAAAQLRDRSVEYRRDAEASRLWHRVYDRLGAEIPGLLGAMTSRAEAQVMRLACLYAVGDMSYVVRLPHLAAALEVWRYCFESARYVFGGVLGDGTADAIFAELQRAYPGSVTKSEISRELLGRNHGADVNRALGLLKQLNLARCERDASGEGRPVERWFWTGDDVTTYDINDISADTMPEEEPEGGFVVNVVASSPAEVVEEVEL